MSSSIPSELEVVRLILIRQRQALNFLSNQESNYHMLFQIFITNEDRWNHIEAVFNPAGNASLADRIPALLEDSIKSQSTEAPAPEPAMALEERTFIQSCLMVLSAVRRQHCTLCTEITLVDSLTGERQKFVALPAMVNAT